MSDFKSKFIAELIDWVKSIAFAIVIGSFVLVFARPSLIIGPSMEPTFQDKNLVLVEKVSYFLHKPNRGDVIVAKTDIPMNAWMNKSVIKRVVGLPGDTVKIDDGVVYINGERYYENYLKDDYINWNGEWLVPEEHYFVMGDNRNNSSDSRNENIGAIEFSEIQGKVYFRLFPFNEIRSF